MKRALCCAILLPLIALAGSKANLMKVQTVVNDGQYVGNTAPVYAAPRVVPKGSTNGTDFVGRIDTVGGTTYDWQVNGPSDQYICVDQLYGVHVTWMYSTQTSGHTDRGMRYNFYDFTAGSWNFIDPTNFMNSGVNAVGLRSGFGNLDVNPISGVAYISSHVAPSNINPIVVRDAAPGAGIFTGCDGSPTADGYQWPSISLTHSEQIHAGLGDAATTFGIFESDVNPWCTWSTPVAFEDTAPVPGFPTYIATGSKTSAKAVISWEYANASGPSDGYYRQTTDDGVTWDPVVPIPLPPAYTPGSETTASFDIAGIYPFLDDNDNLHVVANMMPMIGGTGYIMPVEIWHWFQPTGLWSKVARHECDSTHLMGGVGYNSLYAGRPTLCEGAGNEFICVWECCDSMNVEPQTGLMRADIYAAHSIDNGSTWGPFVRLTDPDSTSKRFPSVATRMWSDTFFVRYEDDLCAGFGIAPYAQGPITNNPIIVQRAHWPIFHAISESSKPRPDAPVAVSCSAHPSPFRGSATIRYDLPKSGNVRLSVCDVLGRTVRMLVNETKVPGRYSAGWDGRDEQGRTLPAGIYFCALEAEGRRLSRKLVLLP